MQETVLNFIFKVSCNISHIYDGLFENVQIPNMQHVPLPKE